jgi:prophage regulatory protein
MRHFRTVEEVTKHLWQLEDCKMEKILRLPEVKAATGKSRSSIYQGMADGSFPRTVALGARAIGWRASDIESWLQSLRGKNEAAPAHLAPARANGGSRAAVAK